MEASEVRHPVPRRSKHWWNIAGHPLDPPDPSLLPSVCALRCVQMPASAVAAWAALRNDHVVGEPQVLGSAFLNEAAIETVDPALEDQAVPPRFWQEFDISKEEVIEVFCMFLLAYLTYNNCLRVRLQFQHAKLFATRFQIYQNQTMSS